MCKILKIRYHGHIQLPFVILFISGYLTLLSYHEIQGNEMAANKMPTILINLLNSNDPIRFAEDHNIRLKDGMMRVVITVERNSSSRDFLSKYNLSDYQKRNDVVIAYVSIDTLKELCEDPSVIYIRLPAKFRGMGETSGNNDDIER